LSRAAPAAGARKTDYRRVVSTLVTSVSSFSFVACTKGASATLAVACTKGASATLAVACTKGASATLAGN